MKRRILSIFLVCTMLISLVLQVQASEINEAYDTIEYYDNCETNPNSSAITMGTGAPDGSSYYIVSSDYDTGGLSSDTSDDLMWEMDIRFDEEGSGFTPRNKKKNWQTCVRRNNNKLALQTGSSDFTSYIDIDPTTWYHIQLIGQFGTQKPMDMVVYKWENGKMEYIATYSGINKRNNNPSSFITIHPGTSVDNIRITRLGADALTLTAVKTEILAGESTPISFTATRQGKEINNPQVEWSVYDEANQNIISDNSVTIDSNGTLTASLDCPTKVVTVRATSTAKGNVVGTIKISIQAVDVGSEKFDNIELSAERDYVRVNEPLPITINATKNGQPVTVSNEDIVWKIYDADNINENKNKYISIQNSTLYVTDMVISQQITVCAQSTSGAIKGFLPVTIKAADALEAGEDGFGDTLLVSNACESIVSDVNVVEGSWDGSHYYQMPATYDMPGLASNTSEDFAVEMDLKFPQDGTGITFMRNDNGKLGMQLSTSGGKLGRVGASNMFTAFFDVDTTSWYHVEIMARCGTSNAYAKIVIYKYDSEGNRVDPTPDDGVDGPFNSTLELRNLSGAPVNHVQFSTNTCVDNFRWLKIVPDDIEMSISANGVFAGNSVQAQFTAYRKGLEIPSPPADMVKWEIYDHENKYPLLNDLIKVDATGLVTVDATVPSQTVYVRATAVGNANIYDYEKLEIKSSDIFTILGLGENEDGTKIVELKVQKDFFYNEKVTFVLAAYDASNKLLNAYVKEMYGESLVLGENKVSVDFTIPEDFNIVKTFVWTRIK